VNERDDIGDDIPPDYFTHIVDGGFYGWPFAYVGGHVDDRVSPSRIWLRRQSPQTYFWMRMWHHCNLVFTRNVSFLLAIGIGTVRLSQSTVPGIDA
jgi:glucose/arabinose dehydrogenase